ncbi:MULTISPECIES: CamS family sex pheromone protein [Bacillus]|uniref:CamS family sex pheromone protein n=1 Tax=Bacillus TaxID=1386 RepID=UPI001E5DC3EF|nr:CamS family sex pheromone protein [Bacillus cereus]MCD2338582.1 CamS family sex pheromone protein [Bacillus cereus]MCU7393084.1 CamS family sex pheromone protein [Bacillus sp. ST24]
MKRFILLASSLSMALVGCGLKNDEAIKSTKDSMISVSNDGYKTSIPFEKGSANGLVTISKNNKISSLNRDAFELGLIRVASKFFSPKEYVFQNGTTLERSTLESLLVRKRTEKQQEDLLKELGRKVPNIGLNPLISDDKEHDEEENKKNPEYIAGILEQNYVLQKSKQNELGGIVIGLVMNSVHYFKEKNDYQREAPINEKRLISEGKKMANDILKIIYQKSETKDVPIIFAIYQQGAQSALIPGSILTYGKVDKGEEEITDWENTNEKYSLFPSEDALSNHRDDSMMLSNFTEKIHTYFPEGITVVGKGFYINGALSDLQIDISTNLMGRVELISFTQYITALVTEKLPDYLPIHLTIKVVNQVKAVIDHKKGETAPIVKILD